MDLFKVWHESQRGNQLAKDLEGRSPFPSIGVVTQNDDPEQRRRVKVSFPKNMGMDSPWLDRKTTSPSDDPPVPKIGQTVEVSFIDGDPHRGVYSGVLTNAKNVAQDTPSPLLDDARCIEGNRSERIDENSTLKVGKKLRLENDAGAYLELHESGALKLGDAFGNQIILGGHSASLGPLTDCVINTIESVSWNLNGKSIEFSNPGNVSISGKSIVVVGSTDSDGDTNNSRGY
jgi:hypothetical protein